MNRYARILMIVLLLLCLLAAGCETLTEIRALPKPQTFIQALAVTQGEISAVRDTMAFLLQASGEDCRANPRTDLCAAAITVRDSTRQYRGQIDDMLTAYNAAHGVLGECRIEINGASIPCQSQQDKILAGLIELRKLIPDGSKKP